MTSLHDHLFPKIPNVTVSTEETMTESQQPDVNKVEPPYVRWESLQKFSQLAKQLIELSTGASGHCEFGQCKWRTEDLVSFIHSQRKEAVEQFAKEISQMSGTTRLDMHKGRIAYLDGYEAAMDDVLDKMRSLLAEWEESHE